MSSAVRQSPLPRVLPRWLDGGMISTDAALRVADASDGAAAWLGADSSGLQGRALAELLGPLFPNWEISARRWSLRKEAFWRETLSTEYFGGESWFEAEVARHASGFVIRLGSMLPPPERLGEESLQEPDGPARRGLALRLLRAETQIQSLTHQWPGVIFSQRPDFGFHFVSPQIERLTGITPAGWKPGHFWQVVHESDAEELKQQIRASAASGAGVSTTYRIRNLQTDKVAYVLEHRRAVTTSNGLILGYEGFWLDVTRQTIAERRLSTAAWKETLAHLTMGLAHDFSNVMAGIHALSESFLAQVKEDHPFHEGLSLIKKNSMQASHLVHRIMHLHHGKTGERNYHNLNELVTDIVDLVKKIIPRRIAIKLECAAASLPLYVDAVEFRQVIINLMLNAADAMPDRGEITFRTSLRHDLPPLSHAQGELPRLPAICLEVSDTGAGIKPSHLPLLFDPFFTTKSANKGSGLGLYNTRLFVEKHHGAVSVESVEGQGATFRIWLPQCDFTEAERSQARAASARRSLILLGNAGKALDSVTEFLRVSGYHVVVSGSPSHAADLIAGREYPFAGLIVLAEENAPGLGSALAAARAQRPPMKTILQVIGRNQDEFETNLLYRVDLIISGDMAQEVILEKLTALFAGNEEGGKA